MENLDILCKKIISKIDEADDLEELNERIENSRACYTKQFSDMNSAVTGFKKTEELLTNFQEAWKASISR